MKRICLFVLACVGLLVPVFAQERIDLTTPLTYSSTTGYTFKLISLDWEGAQITILLRDAATPTRVVTFTYTGATASTLMIALNKANLSTRSLNQRVLDRLIADGKIAGTVTGTVQ